MTPLRQALAAVAAFACLLVATPAAAQPLVEALYLFGDNLAGADPSNPPALPGALASDTPRENGQGTPDVAANGNFAGTVNTDPNAIGGGINGNPGLANSSGAGTFYVFGSTDGGDTPTALLREGFRDGLQQFGLASSAAVDNAGGISYAATITTGGTPVQQSSFRSSVWDGDTVIYVEDDVIPAGPLAGNFFTSAGAVDRSATGVTSWISGYSTTAGGSAIGSALFRDGTAFDVLLQSGDAIAGLGTIDTSFGISNVEWSILGTNYIIEVDVEPGFTSTDEAIVINGAAVQMASGSIVREGAAIPVADGGLPGESFRGFQLLDVTESGDFAFGAFTSGPSGQNDVIVVNGQVVYREGQTVDGVMLSGQPQGLGLNDLGDLAIAWGDNVFINDTKIAGPGTVVDVDGDGDADGDDGPIDGTGLSLLDFDISNLPAAGGEFPIVYFGGEADGGRDGLFRLAPPAPLAGDYNGDGVVNAADYTVYRETDGSLFLLAADGDDDNVIDAGDYGVWSGNFGATAGSPSTTVPEPTAAALVALGALAVAGSRAARR